MMPSLKRPRKNRKNPANKLSKYAIMLLILILLPCMIVISAPDDHAGMTYPGANSVSVFADAEAYAG